MHHKLPNDLRFRAYPRAHSTLQKWIFGNSSENSTKNRYQSFLILSSFAWFFFFFFTFFYYDQDCSHFFVKHYEIFWNKQIYWQMKCTEVKFSDGVFCLQAKKNVLMFTYTAVVKITAHSFRIGWFWDMYCILQHVTDATDVLLYCLLIIKQLEVATTSWSRIVNLLFKTLATCQK